MNYVIKRDKCTGCMSCYNACPKEAIDICVSEEGFKYPKINKEKCIDCGLCKKVCPVLNCKHIPKKVEAYAAYNKDIEVRNNSSSGGIFSLLAEQILEDGGVVFGAAYDVDFSVNHQMVTKISELAKLRGSKYLQSNIDDIYIKVKKQLKMNKKVLFVGTPCQVEGLNHFLQKEYDHLYTQDFICHGCPSPKVFKKYLESIDDINNITSINMRDKQNGWTDYAMNVSSKNKKQLISHHTDKYISLFLNNICLRSTCYDCSFKTKYRNSDVTLADFWGIDNICPEMNDDRGTSLVIINSLKGEKLFDSIKDKMKYKVVNLETSISYNNSMLHSCQMPKKRTQFFKDLDHMDINQIYEKYKLRPTITRKIKDLIKKVLRKLKIMK